MAKSSGGGGEKGKVKFKYVEFELDAMDGTLQESLRNIASAIMRGNGAPQRAQIVSRVNGESAPKNDGEVESEEVTIDDESDQSPETNTSSKASRRVPPRSPVVLEGIDFVKGEMPLAAFLDKTHVTEETAVMKRYLAIAAWFMSHGNTPNVTMDHVHTAFRHMGWRTPTDAASPLRDLKAKQQWLSKGEGKGEYRINHIGENEIMKMTTGNG